MTLTLKMTAKGDTLNGVPVDTRKDWQAIATMYKAVLLKGKG